MKIVLLGLESSGKTTLLKGLLQEKFPAQGSNVKGSTSTILEVNENQTRYMDTPGIRIGSELVSSEYTRKKIKSANQYWFVVRGTHFKEEMEALSEVFHFGDKPIAVIVSFEDKMDQESLIQLRDFREKNKFPLFIVDTRRVDSRDGDKIRELARPVTLAESIELNNLRIKGIKEFKTLYQMKGLGPYVALLTLLVIYSLPIFLAYQFSKRVESIIESTILNSLVRWSRGAPETLQTVLFGDFGLLTLGIYSFIWAFPVVILFGLALAITEESGLKDHITDVLDPLMRKFGLTGQDLVPIINGFGCNVVAIQSSRSCNICTRKNCISVISFGSACSYQLGASLSVFGASGHIRLIFPYIFILIIISLIHGEIWNEKTIVPLFKKRETFLQWPSGQTLSYRLKPIIIQFLVQAMPIFLIICLVASLFDFLGWMDILKRLVAPLLVVIGLSADIAPAFVASLFRKDGILLLNEGNGIMADQLAVGELFIAVFLCSTFTACLVTLVKIMRELSFKEALLLAGKQMITSILSVILFSIILSLYN
ncbi:50S ribosome-binding GTPase [Bacillus sp. SD075]|uniref:nucleoside recognition domain-containing protein n=1 Tax=Bacillus sp. SD075 TaxID=2781732 RepID=UPI001A96BDC3|nr:nucleoside recognition domain-containing protein [Bacillus sp. SD075]MBO0997495.1 50S ribosome-binding GTPase [Bacillus sp. SD075]